MIRKLNLAGEELEFKMTNKTIIDIDEKYDNFGEVINGVMYGKKLYVNSIKVLSFSCITRELTEEELIEKLTGKQMTKELVPIATDIYFDYLGIKKSNKDIENKENNKKK